MNQIDFMFLRNLNDSLTKIPNQYFFINNLPNDFRKVCWSTNCLSNETRLLSLHLHFKCLFRILRVMMLMPSFDPPGNPEEKWKFSICLRRMRGSEAPLCHGEVRAAERGPLHSPLHASSCVFLRLQRDLSLEPKLAKGKVEATASPYH